MTGTRAVNREPRELPPTSSHGKTHSYDYHGCRCDACREAVRRRNRAKRARYYAQRVMRRGRWYAPNVRNHGTRSGYTTYGCRCAPCTAAHCRPV